MTDAQFSVIIYSLIAGISTIIGTILIFANEKLVKKHSVYLISFAAGIMLATSFLHLIPESLEISENVSIFVFIGFLIFYVIQNYLITIHPCNEANCEVHRLGIMSFIGLAIHSLLDGIAIAIGFEVSSSIGIFTAVAVILHEFPEGLITTGILMHTNLKNKRYGYIHWLWH